MRARASLELQARQLETCRHLGYFLAGALNARAHAGKRWPAGVVGLCMAGTPRPGQYTAAFWPVPIDGHFEIDLASWYWARIRHGTSRKHERES